MPEADIDHIYDYAPEYLAEILSSVIKHQVLQVCLLDFIVEFSASVACLLLADRS